MFNIIYNKIIFRHSRIIILILLALTILMSFSALKLKIDASSDTLVLENDVDLKYFQLISKRYYTPDFLVLAYTPNEAMLSDKVPFVN